MTEYELNAARGAFLRALEVGAPGIGQVAREAIANNAAIKLRHQFNVPAPELRPGEKIIEATRDLASR